MKSKKKSIEFILVKSFDIKKKRATVEYNGMELVVAILFTNSTIHTMNDFMKKINDQEIYSKIVLNTMDDLQNYKDDIFKKTDILNDYIANFRNTMNFLEFLPDNIKTIFVSGKKNNHSIINLLNKSLDKKAAKSDIYLELHNDKIIGISVKQSIDAPLSNYSVQRLLDKDTNKFLTNVKKKYLNENGFTCFDKTQRHNMNELFYPKNKTNPYWEKIKENISLYKKSILPQIMDSLYCSNVPYDIYEFNGNSFTKLNKVIDLSEVCLEEYLPYYFTKTGEERQTAKLFYRLVVYEKKFRIEIRWKGNIYDASPQFLIYHDYTEDK